MEFIKKLKPFDYLVIAIVLICIIVGGLTFLGKRTTSSNQIETTLKLWLTLNLKYI